jgi:YesN/AraC family two-component response regulator
MDTFMQEKQPYLLSQFNINQLAVQLEVPVHHMAYFLREVKKQTFSEYRNIWRIEHAKKLIKEGKSNELTLEAIAGLSGFSNRNSFRSIFQKTEGICPSTFAGQNKKTD